MNKPVFWGSVCLLWAIPSGAVFSAEQGQILSYEISTEETGYERLTPVGKDENKKPGRKKEMLIDEMDVYALSPHARLLVLPHMVSYDVYYDKSSPVDWNEIISQASLRYGIAKNLIWAVIKTESNFVAHAVSHKGAVGAMQIMPETQKELGLTKPADAKDNVFAGTKYLKQQLDYFDGNLEFALAAYNAGAGNVLKYKGIPPFKETQNFVEKVLSFMQAYE